MAVIYNLKTIAVDFMASIEKLTELEFSEEDISRIISCKRDLFYNTNASRTNWFSEQALENYKQGKSIKLNTQEHFYSRTKTAYDFLRHFRSGRFNYNRLNLIEAWIKSRIRTHTVTKEENQKLVAIQNGKHTKQLHWTEQYRLAGIPLIKVNDIILKDIRVEVQKNITEAAGPYYYSIDGEIMHTKEILKKFNLTKSAFESRLRAKKLYKNSQYNNWFRVKDYSTEMKQAA